MNNIGFSKLSYLILTIQSLFSMETADMTVTVNGRETMKFRKGIFAAAMNTRAEGGGVPMAPKASVWDGLLSICFVHKYTKFGALLRVPFLALGKQERFSGFKVLDCDQVAIKLEKPMALHTDGEYMQDVTEVTYSCLKGKLRFML